MASRRARPARPWVDHGADAVGCAVIRIDAASPFGHTGQLGAQSFELGDALLNVPQALIDERERLCAHGA